MPKCRRPAWSLLFLVLLAGSARPANAQLPGTTDDENLLPGLLVLGASVVAGWLLFNPPEPSFVVTGEELVAGTGQSRLSERSEPVAVRERGFLKFVSLGDKGVGSVDDAGASELRVRRAGEVESFRNEKIHSVTDLDAAAARAREARISFGIVWAGAAGMILLFAEDQPDEGGSRTLMRLSGAVMGVGAAYLLTFPSGVEKRAREYRETGALALRPWADWDAEGGVRVGLGARVATPW